jgi:hypothetical protein
MKIWNWIIKKWDWWIYCRAFHSIKRMCISDPAFSYLMELQIIHWNKGLKINDKIKESAELFFESIKNHK